MKLHVTSPNRTTRRRFESLDERILLAFDTVYISEFMANNDSVLADVDGHFSDWIELHNPNDTTVNLSSWSLTDSSDDLAEWRFPAVVIPGNGRLTLFASGKNRRDASNELHTNFKLSSGGEYLALVDASGSVIHDFAPAYPAQESDVSYGFSQSTVDLVEGNSPRSIRVLNQQDLGDSWVHAEFDDADWPQVVGPAEYDYRLENGGFEQTRFAPWRISGPVQFAAEFSGSQPTEGEQMIVATTIDSSATRSGMEFSIGLPRSTLDSVNTGNVQRGSAMTRELDLAAGSIITLDWNFLTNDTRDGDFAFVVIADVQDNSRSITLLADPTSSMTATSTGHFSRQTGFEQFSHRVESAGTYRLSFGVVQAMDLEFDSGVIVDNLRIDGQRWSAVQLRNEIDGDGIRSLQDVLLNVTYDESFIAYVNGTIVANQSAQEHLDGNSLSSAEIAIPAELFRNGTNVLAVEGLNSQIGIDRFHLGYELIGVNTPSDSATRLASPTPGHHNSTVLVDDTQVYDGSVALDRSAGFYEHPFLLSMSTEAGATIRFTTDGSVPTVSNGNTYSQPVNIDGTTIVRATAVKDGMASRPTTSTFLFPDDIVQQSNDSAIASGFPDSWNHYGFDPDVIGANGLDQYDGKYAESIRSDLLSIPTISLVMDQADWFGERGLFSNPFRKGSLWERGLSVEFLYPTTNGSFQIDAGLRIHGGISRRTDKHSMRLLFRSDYGKTKLEYPIFGSHSPLEFDSIVLRSSGSEFFGRGRHYIRDETVRRIEQQIGNPSANGMFAHVYVNGLYWGVYNAMERIDEQFAINRDGGEKEEYDIATAERNADVVPVTYDIAASAGTIDSWERLVELANRVGDEGDQTKKTAALLALQGRNPDGSENVNLESYLNVENFIDYIVLNHYVQNTDWPVHNFYMYRRRGPLSDGFKFVVWDAEFSLYNGNQTDQRVSDLAVGPTMILPPLLTSESFRVQFADRVHRLVSPGGALYVNPDAPQWDPEHPENNVPASTYSAIVESVREAIVAESARWGNENQFDPPFTRDEVWLAEVNRNLDKFFPQRTATMLESLRTDSLYRDAPSVTVAAGSQLVLAPAPPTADVYYTLDGTDPRLPNGSVSPNAIRYTSPTVLSGPVTVRARSLADDRWSAIEHTVYRDNSTPATASNIRITEVNYHPLDAQPQFGELDIDGDRFEFIELANVSSTSVDMTGVRLEARYGRGTNFEFGSQTLTGGERVLIPRDRNAFSSRYGKSVNMAVGVSDEPDAWTFSHKLSNNGDSLWLVDTWGDEIQTLSFQDSGDWPSRADGKGSSIELIDVALDPNDPASWRDSIRFGGSPGIAGDDTMPTVVINEVLSNPEPASERDTDFVELINNSSRFVDLQHWYLSDSASDFFRFQIDVSTVLPPGKTRTYTAEDFGFGLRADGESLYLIEADDNGVPIRFMDVVDFEATQSGTSIGRWPNAEGRWFPSIATTPSHDNAGPRVPNVFISEIHRSSIDPNALPNPLIDLSTNYIELTNATSSPIDIGAWRLSGNAQFLFPKNSVIGAHDSIVAVPFYPAIETALAADFREQFDSSDVYLVGPYHGSLPVTSGEIRLERHAAGIGTPYFTEDYVQYAATPPWPSTSFAENSLHRASANHYGAFGASWYSEAVSPGNFIHASPDKVLGVVDVDRVCRTLHRGDYEAKYDLNGDRHLTEHDLDILVTSILRTARGDANLDGRFDSRDLLAVFQVGEYRDDLSGNSTWSDGDWNCDGDFDSDDLVVAFRSGRFQ